MIRAFIFTLCCVVLIGLLIALGMHYFPVTTIILIGILLTTLMGYVYFELIPILFGESPIDTDHQRRRY